jgi:pSer/pThr/pTyr-binding forkhead associated (FHA) protein
VLSEATLSRAHVGFGFDGVAHFVRDLGSTNGTLINGIRERERTLCDGDEVQIGRLSIRFSTANATGVTIAR